MEKERNKKILTILLLMVAVVGISVGFAAFSSTLVIQSGATVTPDASTFAVKFSSSNTALETNAVVPTVSPSTLTNKSGVIDNSGDPKISNLSVEFTAPGQSAVYVFYVRNEGEFLAYLNGIQIPDKTCTPDEGTNKELVDSACNSIKVSVQVGSMNAVEETTLGITGQTLAVDESKQVTVILSYEANGTRADGPFNVTFGDIKLTYSSIADFEVKEEIMQIYRNSTQTVTIGDDITNITYETDPTNISENIYLKHDVENNVVTASYACMTYTDDYGERKDVCVRGVDPSYYASNQEILRGIDGSFVTGGRCGFDDSFSDCSYGSLYLSAYPSGSVYSGDGNWDCHVSSGGYSYCYE